MPRRTEGRRLRLQDNPSLSGMPASFPGMRPAALRRPRASRKRLIWAGSARAAGMKFGEIRLENIGPIRRAAIGRRRLSVFVGPNNSGKSIASRLLHAARRFGPPPSAGGGGSASRASPDALLGIAGMAAGDVVSRSAGSGRIVLADGGNILAEMDFGRGAEPRAAFTGAGAVPESSVYVPAGRAGMAQCLLAAARTGDDAPRPPPGPPRQGCVEEFCAAAAGALSGGLDGEEAAMFSRVLGGSVAAAPGAAACVPAAAAYRDPSGFEAALGSAGSGALSALLVFAAVRWAEPGGTLVVEDPEAHMEPMGQLRLAGELVRAALRRGVDLVLATHSDYVVFAVLGMVHDGVVGPADLGLYYFRRGRGSCTSVEPVHVNRAGEAEGELFEEALGALAKGGVIPAHPDHGRGAAAASAAGPARPPACAAPHGGAAR